MPEFPEDVQVSLFIALTVKIHYWLAPSEWLLQVSVSTSSMCPTGQIHTTKTSKSCSTCGFSIHTIRTTVSRPRPCCLPAASVSHKPSSLHLMVLPIPTTLLEGLFHSLALVLRQQIGDLHQLQPFSAASTSILQLLQSPPACCCDQTRV